MSDIQELLEELATDGMPRGADAVFAGATDRATRHRRARVRRRSLSAVGAVALVVVVVVIAQSSHSGQQPTHNRVGVEGTTTTTIANATAVQLAAGHWSTIPAAPLSARLQTSTVWTGKELIVWGGIDTPSGKPNNDGAAYSPVARTWRKLAPSLLTPHAGAAAVWTGSEVVFWGGVQPEPPGRVTRASVAAVAYSPETNSWRSLGAAPLAPVSAPVGVWSGDRVVLFAGAEAASYDPATRRWERLPSPTPAHKPLAWAFAAAAGPGRILAWSESYGQRTVGPGETVGYGGTDLFRYDESSRRWTALGSAAFSRPDAAFWTGRRLLVRGDISDGAGDIEFGASYDVATGIATPLPTDAVNRDGFAASHLSSAWTGKALWSFNAAGGEGTVRLGDASVYDVTTNTWRRISRAPFSCTPAPPVWTGATIVLYCGAPDRARTGPIAGLEYIPGP